MKAASAIGIVLGCVLIAGGATMEGSNVMAVLNLPAIMIVFGGTLGATMSSCGMDAMKRLPALYKVAFSPPDLDLAGKSQALVGYAEKARRDGLLALDEQLADIDDAYMRKGLQLVVDGTDADLVADVLEAENTAMKKRHALAAQPFALAGGYAPTMGIVGTVFGLIHVLGNLDKPETLGPSIAAAFVATLLGVASANVVFVPIGMRLKALSQEELHARELVLEGILSIQAGDNPRVIAEKLSAYVPPSQRANSDEEEAGAAAAKAA
ncbi:MAG: flagellar motor protein [Actinomycetota bacterium]|nr:flagellar motor protein [Actinomycetota bacterium]